MMGTRHAVATVALLVGGGVGLSGCGGDDSVTDTRPSASLTTSSGASSSEASESATSSPTTSATSKPVDLQTQARQFVTEWVAARNKALSTGDGSDLAALSLKECGYCTGLIKQMSELYDSGGHVEGGAMSQIRRVRAIPQGAGTLVMINFTCDIAASVGRKRDGSIDEKYPATTGKGLYLMVVQARNGWQTQEMGQYQSGT